jgi:hypothetical protein
VKRFSAQTSGSQAGGTRKRSRKAPGAIAACATGGRWESMPATGTVRGSKWGSLDSGTRSGGSGGTGSMGMLE